MIENYADPIDRASAISEAHTERALADMKNRPRVKPTSECVDCGQPIPEARQKATGGTDHCIDCQAAMERRG